MAQTRLDPSRTKVIACATVFEELAPYLPAEMAAQSLEFGLHAKPGSLKQTLQDAIDACGEEYDTLLLGYGLCSMALVGLRSKHATLVIPRVDDCIAIFLGSSRAYAAQASAQPGTYYLTKGWIEVADTPFSEWERLVTRYGEETAAWIMQAMLKNYTRLAYIDTGRGEKREYIETARKSADKFNLRFEEIPGSPALVRKLISGEWDEEILVVPPQHIITLMDFRSGEPASPSGFQPHNPTPVDGSGAA